MEPAYTVNRTHHDVGILHKVHEAFWGDAGAVAIKLDTVPVVGRVHCEDGAVQQAGTPGRQLLQLGTMLPRNPRWLARNMVRLNDDWLLAHKWIIERGRSKVPVTRSPMTKPLGRSRGTTTSGIGSPVTGSWRNKLRYSQKQYAA